MKCPICKMNMPKKHDVLKHMDSRHFNEIPPNMSVAKYYYALNHGGETTGKCRMCNGPTQFDEVTGRTKPLCGSEKCKEAFANMAKSRNMKVYGVPHLLNNQQHQMYMLSKRKISGEYQWSNGTVKVPYVGSYERRFLEFLDNFLNFDPSTIHSPSPFTIYYEFDGEQLSHTPDMYIDVLDLLIEIKHGGNNPNTHPKIQKVDAAKDKAKENAIRKNTSHNYIKITDNNFLPFVKFMFELVENDQFNTKKRMFMINESIEEIGLIQQPTTLNDIDTFIPDQKSDINLHIHVFTEIFNSHLDIIDIFITLDDNRLIKYDNEQNILRYLTKEEYGTIKDKYMVSFKYSDPDDILGELHSLKTDINDSVLYKPFINITNLITTIFYRIFDSKVTHSYIDIFTNPAFIKYQNQGGFNYDKA